MTADFPIGTRLIIDGHTFEVAESSGHDGFCTQCIAKGFAQYGICHILRCWWKYRQDGKRVHWKLIEDSV